MVERRDWDGVLRPYPRTEAQVVLTAPLQASALGATGAFLGLGSDRKRYWIKAINNPVGSQALVKEQVVGMAATLMGAPAAPTTVIRIPEELAGWEYRRGRVLVPGTAHATLHIERARETRTLDRMADDDNGLRYVGFAALFDWCWGDDWQGLHAMGDEKRFYSIDYDWYLPPGGQGWDRRSIVEYVDVPHELPVAFRLPAAAAARVAIKLEGLTRADIAKVLRAIPGDWGKADAELEDVGFLLERRAPQVAQRLRARAGAPA